MRHSQPALSALRPAILLAVTLLAARAWADVVVLKTGAEFKGTITKEDSDTVTIRSEGVNWTFKRDKIATMTLEASGRAANSAQEKAKAAMMKKTETGVIVYGTSWCRYCRLAREYLRSQNVQFIDKDVEADDDANMEVKQKCVAAKRRCSGIPVLDVYGRILEGFSRDEIDRALRAHRT